MLVLSVALSRGQGVTVPQHWTLCHSATLEGIWFHLHNTDVSLQRWSLLVSLGLHPGCRKLVSVQGLSQAPKFHSRREVGLVVQRCVQGGRPPGLDFYCHMPFSISKEASSLLQPRRVLWFESQLPLSIQ